jgi:hypothetical protein
MTPVMTIAIVLVVVMIMATGTHRLMDIMSLLQFMAWPGSASALMVCLTWALLPATIMAAVAAVAAVAVAAAVAGAI